MRRTLLAAAVVVLAACDTPRTVSIPLPNTASPEKEGQVEIVKFGEKVVVTNHTDRSFWDCVLIVDDAIRGPLGILSPRQTVTVMRTRFRPYTEVDDFYARARKLTVLECSSADQGRIRVLVEGGPEYTVPAEALKQRSNRR